MPSSSPKLKAESAERECRSRLARLRTARIDGDFEERFEPLVSEIGSYVKGGALDWTEWASKLVEQLELDGAQTVRIEELYGAAQPHAKMSRSESARKASESKVAQAEAKAERTQRIAQKGWIGVVEHIEGQCAIEVKGVAIIGEETWEMHAVSGMTGKEGRAKWGANARGRTRAEVHARLEAVFGHGLDGIDGDEWAILWPVLALKAEHVEARSRALFYLEDVLRYKPADGSILAWEEDGWWHPHYPDENVRAVWPGSVVGLASKARTRLPTVEVVLELRRQGWTAFEAAASDTRSEIAYMQEVTDADESRDE